MPGSGPSGNAIRKSSRLTASFEPYAGHIAAAAASPRTAIAVIGLSGAMEAVGISILLPLLAADVSTRIRALLLLVFLAFLVASAFIKHSGDRMVAKTATGVELAARRDLTRTLASAQWDKVSRVGQGDINSAVLSESSQIANGVIALLTAWGALLVVCALSVSAIIISPLLSVLGGVFGLVAAVVYRRQRRSLIANESAISKQSADLAEELSDVVNDLRYVRAIRASHVWQDQADRDAIQMQRLRYLQLVLPSSARRTIDVIAGVFLSSILAATLLIADDLQVGLVFLAIFYRVIPRLQAAQQQFSTARAQAAWTSRWADRIANLQSGERSLVPTADLAEPILLTLEDVTYTYPTHTEPAIGPLSLDVRRGELLAVTGPSGSGKTTLIELILGLRGPTTGSITFDQSLLTGNHKIGFVPQDPPFKRGTIRQNLQAFSDVVDPLNGEILHVSQLSAVIQMLPAGLDTELSSNTVGLSGGQRKRLALARALLRKPDLLVLDEMGSGLDIGTETAIMEGLKQLSWRPAIIYISHTVGSASHAHRELVLNSLTKPADRKGKSRG